MIDQDIFFKSYGDLILKREGVRWYLLVQNYNFCISHPHRYWLS